MSPFVKGDLEGFCMDEILLNSRGWIVGDGLTVTMAGQ